MCHCQCAARFGLRPLQFVESQTESIRVIRVIYLILVAGN